MMLMAKKVKLIALISTLLTLLSAIIYMCTGSDAVFTLLITCGTTAYHFLMRLAVGGIINRIFHNRMNYRASWFAQRPFEKKLYKALRVKKWKGKALTYNPEAFSLEKHSLDEIALVMTKSEVDHWINEGISLFSILFSLLWGETWIFVLTAVLAMVFDAQFIVIQRFNRPRILRILKKQSLKKEEKIPLVVS